MRAPQGASYVLVRKEGREGILKVASNQFKIEYVLIMLKVNSPIPIRHFFSIFLKFTQKRELAS